MSAEHLKQIETSSRLPQSLINLLMGLFLRRWGMLRAMMAILMFCLGTARN